MELTSRINDLNTTNDTSNKQDFKEFDVPLSYLIIVNGIGLFGIMGNCLTLKVLFKINQWTSVNTLIGIMSFSDLFSLIVLLGIPLQIVIFEKFYDQTVYFQDAFISSSFLCALLIGLERTFAVRKPLKFREIWNTKLTIKIYVACYTVCIAFIVSRCLLSELISYQFFQAHVYLMYFMLLRGIPFIIILVNNILMIRGLIQNGKMANKMINQEADKKRIKNETKITKTVVVMTTTYFICMIPSRISVGLKHFGVFVDENEIVYYVQSVFEVFNLSVNIVIYTVTSTFFRKEFISSLCSCLNHFQRIPPTDTSNRAIPKTSSEISTDATVETRLD